jgi:hypothetical protein
MAVAKEAEWDSPNPIAAALSVKPATTKLISTSVDFVLFILICIEVDSAFLRDGPVDGERPASHDATWRMLAAL